MIQESGFVDSNVLTNDYRYYNSEQVTTPFKYLVTTGIQHGGENLQVTQGAYPLSTAIAPGMAWIKGRWYILKDDGLGDGRLAVLHDAAVQFPRIDRVVLRLEFGTERSIKAAVIKGVEALTPEAPALTRQEGEQGTFEICLAQVTVRPGEDAIAPEDIFETRFDEDLCGIADFAPRPNLQPYITEWDNTFQQFQAGWQTEFSQSVAAINAYYEQMQIDFDAWLAMQESRGYAPALRKVYGETLEQDISPPASNIPATNPVSGGAGNVQASLNSLFQSASDMKSRFVGIVGSPATTAQTSAEIQTHGQNAKNTMAANLTAKGVSASGTETMAALATKISSVSTGYNRVDEYAIITSGNWAVPASCYKIDICMVGGGGGGGGGYGTPQNCSGYGGGLSIQGNIPVTPGQVLGVTVGAGGAPVFGGNGNPGGNTIFGSYSVAGGQGGINGVDTPSGFKRMWNITNGVPIAGNGSKDIAVNLGDNTPAGMNYVVVDSVVAGGGAGYSVSAPGYVNAKATYGGGGGHANGTGSPGFNIGNGSSGRVHVRCYIR